MPANPPVGVHDAIADSLLEEVRRVLEHEGPMVGEGGVEANPLRLAEGEVVRPQTIKAGRSASLGRFASTSSR